MKGVVLAGGTATRLKPLTSVLNKHLIPVFRKPMVYYPIQTLIDGGIKDILIILGGESVGMMIKLLGDGSEFGARFYYRHQGEALGIAHALNLARDFVDGNFALILGDNIFTERVNLSVAEVPHVFLAETNTPEKFGVAVIERGRLVRIVEKPKEFVSNWAVTGLYIYPKNVFVIIDNLEPSARGELEITDLNNKYACAYSFLHSPWFDVGEYDTLLKAANYIKEYYDSGSED